MRQLTDVSGTCQLSIFTQHPPGVDSLSLELSPDVRQKQQDKNDTKSFLSDASGSRSSELPPPAPERQLLLSPKEQPFEQSPDLSSYPLDALEICLQYLNSRQSTQDKNDTKNSLIRYFVPATGGPAPSARKHQAVSPQEEQTAFAHLKTVSLLTLAHAPDLALKLLKDLNSSPSQRDRVRHTLRALVDWAQEQHYLPLPENPIPAGICAHIKINRFKGLTLIPSNARQIVERYLEQIEEREIKANTINAIIRFFIPGCGGPQPFHKPARPYETKAGLEYLETVPLEYLNEALAIATAVLEVLQLAPTQGTRIRNALRTLVGWARTEHYLPEPTLVAPWGGEHLPPAINPERCKQEQPTAFEQFQNYSEHLKQSGRNQEINALQTAVIRYLVPAQGGPIPTHRRATASEVQAGLAYLKQIAADQLGNAVDAVETEFERLELRSEKCRPIRSRLKGWLHWYIAQNPSKAEQELQPIFTTYHTSEVPYQQPKPGAELHEKRCPKHALCAKEFPEDYINDDLQTQLEDYEKWRLSNDVTPGSLKTEKEQILQLLGWLHRYENVSLDELCFECMITKSQLVFDAAKYRSYSKYLRQREIGIQSARTQADKDILRVNRYLKFVGENPKSKTRRLFIVLSIAKFVYRDVLGTDDFPVEGSIPILLRLLNCQVDLKKKGKSTPQTVSYHETSVSWVKAIEAMEHERRRADQSILAEKQRSRSGYKLRQRPDTGVANDLQRLVSFAFCLTIPSRARTFYDLRIGETFEEGILDQTFFLSVQELKQRGIWEQCKDDVRFYIHHKQADYKVGKSMAPALLNNDGWRAEIPNLQFSNADLYSYIRRWLDWGRVAEGPVNHNFFFRQAYTPAPMNGGDWNSRIKKIFRRWTGVFVPPKNVRKMFASQFPEYREAAALLLQHSEQMHITDYDMRQTVEKMAPLMKANARLMAEVISSMS